MPQRYFELSDDVSPGKWQLGLLLGPDRQQLDEPWRFRMGERTALIPGLGVHLQVPGTPVDFALADYNTPVVHARVAGLLAEVAPADVQLVPVEVASCNEAYFILNVTRVVKCIDDKASTEVKYWKPEDGRPEKTGNYRAVYGMRIDPALVGEAKVFRTWGWTSALIVSEDIKETLERARVTGVRFKEVTGPSAISPEERERKRKLLELREQTDAAREAFWRTLGQLEEGVITPIVGGAWPARRQVWRVIHRSGGRTLLVTDGLSDFFVDRAEASVGFGLELALETDAPLKHLEKSWPLVLLERVGDEVVAHEHVRAKLKVGLMTMEVSGEGMPKPLVTQEGRVGVVLGMQASTLPGRFTMPAGEVRLVTVKALLPRELTYLLEHGTKGREDLLHRFVASGDEHLSRAKRSAVV